MSSDTSFTYKYFNIINCIIIISYKICILIKMSTNGNSSCHAQERDIHREYRRFKYYIILYIIEKLWKRLQDASIDLPAKAT